MEYTEPRSRSGLRGIALIYAFLVVAVGSMIAAPLAYVDLFRGVPSDVIAGGYLVMLSPFVAAVGPLRTFARAALLRTRPVEASDSGLVFPTQWLGTAPSMAWDRVRVVTTDFPPDARMPRALGHIYLLLSDGAVLSRPYELTLKDVANMRNTLAAIGSRAPVVGFREFVEAARIRIASRTTARAVRVASFLAVPLSIAVTWLVNLLLSLDLMPHLYWGVALWTSLVASAPLWSWSRRQDVFLELVEGHEH